VIRKKVGVVAALWLVGLGACSSLRSGGARLAAERPEAKDFVSRDQSLRLRSLGSFSLTQAPGFAVPKWLEQQPWQGRGRHAVGAPVQSEVSPLILGEDKVLVSTVGGGVGLWDLRLGRYLWMKSISIGVAAQPKVVGSSVIVATLDGQVLRLSLDRGTEEWSVRVGLESTGGVQAGAGLVFVTIADDSLVALDEVNGNKLWTYRRPAPDTSVRWSLRGQGTPALSSDGAKVYAGFSDGTFVALNSKTGKTIWERNFKRGGKFQDADLSPTLLKTGDRILLPLVDGDLLCLRESDGNTLWALSAAGAAVPLVDESKNELIASTWDGRVLRADLATGSVQWERKLGDRGVATAPVFLLDRYIAYSTSRFGLELLSRSSGELLWSHRTGTGTITPVFFDGYRLGAVDPRNELRVFAVENRLGPSS
jgi:outer membrane protein assembly factor BamB